MPTRCDPCPGKTNAITSEIPRQRGLRLFLVDRARLPAAVIPAVGAHAVRRLRLVAMRAFGETHRLERVCVRRFAVASWSVVVLDSASSLSTPCVVPASTRSLWLVPFSAARAAREPRVLPRARAGAGARDSGWCRRPGTGRGSRRGTAASSAATSRTAPASTARGRSRRARRTPSSDRLPRSRARLRRCSRCAAGSAGRTAHRPAWCTARGSGCTAIRAWSARGRRAGTARRP